MPRNLLAGLLKSRVALASMRPRQMPRNFQPSARRNSSEPIGFNEAAADAAEFSDARRVPAGAEPASMRPRQMPRNFGTHIATKRGLIPIASMRPRQMPRNFCPPPAHFGSAHSSFNEAAADAAEFSAYSLIWGACAGAASMRPRQMPRNFAAFRYALSSRLSLQ